MISIIPPRLIRYELSQGHINWQPARVQLRTSSLDQAEYDESTKELYLEESEQLTKELQEVNKKIKDLNEEYKLVDKNNATEEDLKEALIRSNEMEVAFTNPQYNKMLKKWQSHVPGETKPEVEIPEGITIVGFKGNVYSLRRIKDKWKFSKSK